ncbi:ion transmembrane transporter [Aureococcus anophagefferens]|uniref:Ion transmembrane transporter n=1 Tax=Aureococcus anophagefferens TaxID=44056 RepID=A0ABR1G0U0_AURAN
MAEVVPKFTPGQPRYSPETFGGRLRNIASQLNPFMLLKSDGDVDAAKALLRRHDAGASNASDAELWAAQELCAARPPIALGMLWPGGGALNQAFWQCYNQSYNSAVFFANKNKSSPVSDADARAVAVVRRSVGVRRARAVAAREGIGKCCAARVVWNIPATGITPVALAAWHATPLCAGAPAPKMAVDTAIITSGIIVGVYGGQALYVQRASIDAAALEPEFQGLAAKDGRP